MRCDGVDVFPIPALAGSNVARAKHSVLDAVRGMEHEAHARDFPLYFKIF
jgi:hypothetical protein